MSRVNVLVNFHAQLFSDRQWNQDLNIDGGEKQRPYPSDPWKLSCKETFRHQMTSLASAGYPTIARLICLGTGNRKTSQSAK
jgi:hypothetical protein